MQTAADVLVAHGARPLMLVDGESAVSEIISSGRIGRTLEWPGMDLPGQGGAHLLNAAIRAHQYAVIARLLDAGANPRVGDYEGAIPLKTYLNYVDAFDRARYTRIFRSDPELDARDGG